MRIFPIVSALAATLLIVSISACDYAEPGPSPRAERGAPTDVPIDKRETIFGQGGIGDLFSDDKKPATGGVGAGLGVNAYLWRASLDTVSIWPISSADPFGGVIITDWYSPPESPGERFKMNVYILDRALRADGVRVALFRQVADRRGQWHDAPVLPSSSVKLENAILNRARQFRNETLKK